MSYDRSTTYSAVLAMLAADLACAPEDLDRDGIVIVVAEQRPGRRAFPMCWRSWRVMRAR